MLTICLIIVIASPVTWSCSKLHRCYALHLLVSANKHILMSQDVELRIRLES
jgi:hypothetical protein